MLIKGKAYVSKKEFISFLFALYLIILVYIVTFKDNNYGTNNFTLFKEILRYKITSKLFIKNVIGNILLFIPLGIFLSYFIKERGIFLIVIVPFLLSGLIEFIQSKIGRCFDVDDIILNFIGGIIGYIIYRFQIKFSTIFERQIIKDVLYLITILIIIYLSFKFNFWRLLWTILRLLMNIKNQLKNLN